MSNSPIPSARSFLTVQVTSNETSAIVEVRGGIERASAAHLLTDLMGLIHDTTSSTMVDSIAVDLSDVAHADGSLFMVLARAHTALKARRGHLYLIVADDEVLTLIHAAGFERITPVFMTRDYRDRVDAEVVARQAPARVNQRQRVIDLREAHIPTRRGPLTNG